MFDRLLIYFHIFVLVRAIFFYIPEKLTSSEIFELIGELLIALFTNRGDLILEERDLYITNREYV